jgi:hypothetical protein
MKYAWKNLKSGEIIQSPTANSPEMLFEMQGFGAINVDKPIKGYLAVRVEKKDGVFVEKEAKASLTCPFFVSVEIKDGVFVEVKQLQAKSRKSRRRGVTGGSHETSE